MFCFQMQRSVLVTQNVLKIDNVSMRNAWILVHTERFAHHLHVVELLHTEASVIAHQELKEIRWKLVLLSVARVMMIVPKMKPVIL